MPVQRQTEVKIQYVIYKWHVWKSLVWANILLDLS